MKSTGRPRLTCDTGTIQLLASVVLLLTSFDFMSLNSCNIGHVVYNFLFGFNTILSFYLVKVVYAGQTLRFWSFIII